MTEDRSSIIILFLFLSANHIPVTWHWVKSLIHYFACISGDHSSSLGCFGSEWSLLGHWHLWESSPQICWGSGLWRQIITSELFGTILSLSCDRNALERGAVSSEKLFQIIMYWGDALDGLDENFIPAKSSYFLQERNLCFYWPEEVVSAWACRLFWDIKVQDFKLFLSLSFWNPCSLHCLWVLAEVDTYPGSCASIFYSFISEYMGSLGSHVCSETGKIE